MDIQIIDILLVEDSEDDIVLIREALADARLMNLMHVVRDGEEAMAYLRREGTYAQAPMPGLVLLDINMPKKNGLEVLAEIKADPALRHLPVIMLTVSKREEDVIASYGLGASSYVRKPVTFSRLQEVFREFEIYWALIAKIPAPKR